MLRYQRFLVAGVEDPRINLQSILSRHFLARALSADRPTVIDFHTDPDVPLKPPVGRSGRAETSRQAYSIDAVNEFDPLFEDVYEYCEKMDLGVDTLIHEVGAGQMEINFFHDHPLGLADEVRYSLLPVVIGSGIRFFERLLRNTSGM